MYPYRFYTKSLNARKRTNVALIHARHYCRIQPYDAIPGPRPLPLLGNFFLYTKFGAYPLERFWQSAWRLYDTFGPVVKVVSVKPGLDMVWLFDPDDIRCIYKDEVQCPVRPEFEILKVYRKSRSALLSPFGLVNGNGLEWYRLRKAISTLLQLDTVSTYRERQAFVASELVNAISRFPSKGISYEVVDLLPLLFRYTLEAIGVVALGRYQGCLSEGHPEADRIIAANESFLLSLGESVFSPPLYRIWHTPSYTRLSQAHDYITSVVQKSFEAMRFDHLHNNSEFRHHQPFVWTLLSNPDLTARDILLILTEVFMGGIDATATTIAFCLYFLARHPEWQIKLHHEIADVDPVEGSLQNLPLLQGVIKESYRLRPSPTGVARILQKDAVFGGYCVKKGVLLQGIPFLSSRNPIYFENPDSFNPERWFRLKQSLPHPYSVLPFSHGVRMCPGRRLAEQEIKLAIITVCQHFLMEQSQQEVSNPESSNKTSQFNETGLGQVLRMNMMPNAPISVKFSKRS